MFQVDLHNIIVTIIIFTHYLLCQRKLRNSDYRPSLQKQD
jgi:hypothetical protein